MTPINNVGDLIDALANLPRETPVRGTREGCDKDVFLYMDAKGRVMLDEDECFYQARWQELKCVTCGKDARAIVYGKPVCYGHYGTENED